jgi:hypothetical protein
MTAEQRKIQDEAILAIFEDISEEEYVEVYGEKFLFDSKFCEKWNRVMGLAGIIMLAISLF